MVTLIMHTSILSLNYYDIDNKSIVNPHTYLRRLTPKGTIACVKRLSEISKVKIKLPMDRLTNLNSTVGSEVPFSYIKNMQGAKNYLVFFVLNQSKQPTRSSRVIGEGPKGIYCQKLSEFGISRNTKVWGDGGFIVTLSSAGRNLANL